MLGFASGSEFQQTCLTIFGCSWSMVELSWCCNRVDRNCGAVGCILQPDFLGWDRTEESFHKKVEHLRLARKPFSFKKLCNLSVMCISPSELTWIKMQRCLPMFAFFFSLHSSFQSWYGRHIGWWSTMNISGKSGSLLILRWLLNYFSLMFWRCIRRNCFVDKPELTEYTLP